MIDNPISIRRSEPVRSATRWLPAEMRAWCEMENERRLARELDRWYYVDTDEDGNNKISFLDGVDGGIAHMMLDGKQPEFAGWSEARMDGYCKWLRGIIKRGITPEGLDRKIKRIGHD